MPTPPPRKRFQIHLSTAIVMMFVAGGLMWANTRDSGPMTTQNGAQHGAYGWPMLGVFIYHNAVPFSRDAHIIRSYSFPSIAFDLLAAIYFLIGVCFLSERLRRRAGRSAR